MGTRQKSQLPIRDSRKSFQDPNRRRTINESKVPKGLDRLSSEKNRTGNSVNIPHHLRDPLTPLHRLHKFKVIRDRNLKKTTKGKNLVNKFKMSVDVEKDDTGSGRQNAKEMQGIKEKIEQIRNGTQENGDKRVENSNKKVEKVPPVEENGEVNGSGEKDGEIFDEKKQIEIEKSPKDNKETIEKECLPEDKIINIDAKKENDGNDKEDISEELDDNGDVLKVDSDDDEHRETDYESSHDDEPPQEKVKILRRSFRQELLRSKASTSKTVEEIKEKPKEKQSSLSPESLRRIRTTRVQGRRSIWQNKDIHHRKRKFDDHNESDYDIYGKKQALKYAESNTPSVLSPGWKFVSSPFTRFWTPKSSPIPGLTPYKSLTGTPYPNNDNEDSLTVNVDDKSLYNKLDDSEFEDISIDSTQSSTNNNNWRCNIM